MSPADRARLPALLLIRLRCVGRTKSRGVIAARSCTTFDIGISFASSMRQGAPNHDHWPTPHLPPGAGAFEEPPRMSSERNICLQKADDAKQRAAQATEP